MSIMSEKLCLQWNDYQENVKNAFASLRGVTDFVDVTLACEDGNQIEAHKVILAASCVLRKHSQEEQKQPPSDLYEGSEVN